jgi:type II secretory pathway component PulJ
MIAIAILSIIMGIVYKTFATVSESDRRIRLLGDTSATGRNIMEMLSRDLSSLFITSSGNTERDIEFRLVCDKDDNENSRIDFVAAAPTYENGGAISLVEYGYYLEKEEDKDSYALVKRIDETPDEDVSEGGYSVKLAGGLASFSIRFMGKDESWKEKWESGSAGSYPSIVEISFSLLKGELKEEDFSTRFRTMQRRKI